MKKFIYIFILVALVSCTEKEKLSEPPAKMFTATITVTPTPQTLYYHVYATNDKNAPLNMRLYVGTVQASEIKNGKAVFGFDAPVVCGVTIEKDKPVYGCSQEMTYGNIPKDMDYNSVTIK